MKEEVNTLGGEGAGIGSEGKFDRCSWTPSAFFGGRGAFSAALPKGSDVI